MKSILAPFLLWTVALLLVLLPATGRAQNDLAISLGFEYERGDYGGDREVSSYAVPLSLSWYPGERVDLTLTIPTLYQSRGTSVVLGNQRFSLPSNSQGAAQPPGNMGNDPDPQTPDTERSRSGLGDISLEAGYRLQHETQRSPLVRLILYGKFPTADEKEGLGTGALDLGIGAGTGKWFGDWSLYMEGIYIRTGRSQSYAPDNYWTFLAALDRLLSARLQAGVSLSAATAAFGGDDILEISGNLAWLLTDRVTVRGYLGTGLTDSSAAISGGVAAGLSF